MPVSLFEIDAPQVFRTGVPNVRKERPRLGSLNTTPHQRLLDLAQPDVANVVPDGRVATKGPERPTQLEADGDESFRR